MRRVNSLGPLIGVAASSLVFISVDASAQGYHAPSATGTTADSPSTEASETTASTPRSLDDARVHFDRGIELFGEGSYEAALVEFDRAYQIAPSYRIQYNVGRIHRQLNHYAEALNAFQEYLTRGGSSIPAA